MIPQPRARRRHEKILDAALRVFAKKGYREAAVDDIAVESKTSKGGVYFHFPGKQAIFLELLNRTAARLRAKIEEAIAAENEPIARADAALLVVLRTFASHRALARLFMIEALGAGKEFHQRLSEIHDEFATIIKDQLDDAVRQGVIAPLDTQVAATAWFGALNEVVTRWLLSGTPERLQEAYDALRPLLIRSVGAQEKAAQADPGDVLRMRLRAVLDRALTTARDASKGVLASVCVEAPEGIDPLALFAAATGPRVFWQQPSDGLSMVALGQAARIEASGADRFDIARSEWATLVRDAVTDAGAAPIEPPVALGGFAFDPAGGPAALPDSRLTVPRVLLTSHRGGAWLTLTALVTQDTDVEKELAQFEASVDEVAAAGVGKTRRPDGSDAACVPEATDRDAFEAAVASAIEEMRGGRLEKVVLARRVRVEGERPFDLGSILERLAGRYTSCTVFAFADDGACFLGATPERLLRIQDGVVTVDCLAGTIGRGGDEAADASLASQLLHDPKELHEHQVVATAIKSMLQPLCADLEIPSTPRIATFPNVHHLFTPISGTAMPGHDVLEFVESLHPTPATGGYPREEALPLIRRLEGFGRGWYAGPVGWLDAAGNGDYAVAIRSALVEGNTATLYAGNGIVAESQPAREYDETNVKLKAMLWALGQE